AEAAQLAAGGRVPQDHDPERAARRDPPAIRADRHRPGLVHPGGNAPPLPTPRHVPDHDRAPLTPRDLRLAVRAQDVRAVAGRDEVLAVGREGEAVHGRAVLAVLEAADLAP